MKPCSLGSARGGKFLLRWPNKQRDAPKMHGGLGFVRKNNGPIWETFRAAKTSEIPDWEMSSSDFCLFVCFFNVVSVSRVERGVRTFPLWLFSSAVMWPNALCKCLSNRQKQGTGSGCVTLFARWCSVLTLHSLRAAERFYSPSTLMTFCQNF